MENQMTQRSLGKSFWFVVLSIVMLIVVLGITLFSIIEFKKDRIGLLNEGVDRRERLFIADGIGEEGNSGKTHYIKILVYDIKTGEVTSKRIKTIDPVSLLFPAYYTVQFNEFTGDIFYLTDGRDSLGSPCINKDKSCAIRIYKTNINEDGSQKIFEQEGFEDIRVEWLLHEPTNSVFVSIYSHLGGETIKKTDLKGDKMTTLPEINHGFSSSRMFVSKDGEYIYRLVEEEIAVDNELSYGLYLIRVEILTGEVEKIKVYNHRDGFYNEGMEMSPDGRFFAFRLEGETEYDLAIFDAVRKKIIPVDQEGELWDGEIRWSGDSKKLLYSGIDYLGYYNVETSKNFFIKEKPNTSPVVISWAPSIRYILYIVHNTERKIYDAINNKEITLSPEFMTEVGGDVLPLGTEWF